jgi:tetratricopeptide (TPR) repeat protein
MDSDVARLAAIYKYWAWVGKNRKQVLWAVGILAVVVLVGWLYVWKVGEAEVAASEALSDLRPASTAPGGPEIPAEAYLKVVNEYPKTDAAARGLLLAASAFFTQGKYAEAKTQFDRLLRDYPQNPLCSQALLGSAACLGAQGKTAEAVTAYDGLLKRHPADPVVPRAKFGLASSYEAQHRSDDAIKLYEELMRTESYSSVGAEAEIRLQELRRSAPAPVGAAPAATTPVVTAPAVMTPAKIPVPVLQTNKP